MYAKRLEEVRNEAQKQGISFYSLFTWWPLQSVHVGWEKDNFFSVGWKRIQFFMFLGWKSWIIQLFRHYTFKFQNYGLFQLKFISFISGPQSQPLKLFLEHYFSKFKSNIQISGGWSFIGFRVLGWKNILFLASNGQEIIYFLRKKAGRPALVLEFVLYFEK